jgi:hypothetical protein
MSEYVIDFFDRIKIYRPKEIIKCDKCIFTLASPGYEQWLDDMLLSVKVNGDIPEAKIVIFFVDPDKKCLDVAKKYDATVIVCESFKAIIILKLIM